MSSKIVKAARRIRAAEATRDEMPEGRPFDRAVALDMQRRNQLSRVPSETLADLAAKLGVIDTSLRRCGNLDPADYALLRSAVADAASLAA